MKLFSEAEQHWSELTQDLNAENFLCSSHCGYLLVTDEKYADVRGARLFLDESVADIE